MSITRLFLSGLALFIAASATSSASAQDFSCSTARNAAERSICSSRALSALDERMARVYGQIWELYGRRPYTDEDRISLRSQQRQFLGSRDSCEDDVGCLRGAYDDHIGQLSGWLKEARRVTRS